MACGLNDNVDKATKVYEAAGARVYNLSRTGAVRVRWTAERVEIRAWREDPW
ncbi:MAG: hypothetical protein QM811_10860 [Pirellulales bacterium]